MVAAFASIEDITQLWRAMTPDEAARAAALLPVVSNLLRQKAFSVGKDLDKMAEDSEVYRSVLCSTTVDIVTRTLMTSTSQEPMTQMSQSAGGYSVSGTFLVPGGGLFIKRDELQRLGLRQQRVEAVDFYA